jgi:uroporphyrin-III C-methyltransferase
MSDGHDGVPGDPVGRGRTGMLGASHPRSDHGRPFRERGPAGGSEPAERAAGAVRTSDAGQVYLVGAGPGDPDLLTRRAWDLLRAADSVLHDSLTAAELLAEIPDGVAVEDVGKRPPDPVSQAEIHDRLTSRAGAGETVVRLKGGDPTVFGRGGEEAEHLASEGIPFEVVPGVSSLLAAPRVAGIPLTHRDHASSLTVVTGRENPEKEGSSIDWAAIADTLRAGGTLVVLMGVGSLPTYAGALRREGVPDGTPLAFVQRATWDDERTVTTTLGNAVADADAADVRPPAVTIVGDVVEVRDTIETLLSRD